MKATCCAINHRHVSAMQQQQPLHVPGTTSLRARLFAASIYMPPLTHVRPHLTVNPKGVEGSVGVGPMQGLSTPAVVSAPFSSAAAAPHTLVGVVRCDAAIYHDDPVGMSLSFQLRDQDTFDVVHGVTEIGVKLKPTCAGCYGAAEVALTVVCNSTAAATATPSDQQLLGVCHMRIPSSSWFKKMSAATDGFAVHATVLKPDGASAPTVVLNGQAPVATFTAVPAPTPLASTIRNTVAIKLPSRPLYEGDVFELEVRPFLPSAFVSSLVFWCVCAGACMHIQCVGACMHIHVGGLRARDGARGCWCFIGRVVDTGMRARVSQMPQCVCTSLSNAAVRSTCAHR
jgi:hypothetical protein